MANRRAIYAARFLRPPGFMKRVVMREKPRDQTGPFENPVRRFVRLREKAQQFCELPPPRKIPVLKPAKTPVLNALQGVPQVSPEALQKRLEFLLGEGAVQAQLAAPMRPGMTPFHVELFVWYQQMRDLRRIYRAQYLQKLAEVTEIERAKEAELRSKEAEERRRKKEKIQARVTEDMKRRAILHDRVRIEKKVTEAMEMARRSKEKRRKIFWLRRMETLSKMIVTADNLEASFEPTPGEDKNERSLGGLPAVEERNVSIPQLLRQLGGAKTFAPTKSRRVPFVENVEREILEASYDIREEDAERFEPAPSDEPTPQEKAKMTYGSFSDEEKLRLLDEKIAMLKSHMENMEHVTTRDGMKDALTAQLYDELMATKMAFEEKQREKEGRAAVADARDPATRS